jgi:hypothetical protein
LLAISNSFLRQKKMSARLWRALRGGKIDVAHDVGALKDSMDQDGRRQTQPL